MMSSFPFLTNRSEIVNPYNMNFAFNDGAITVPTKHKTPFILNMPGKPVTAEERNNYLASLGLEPLPKISVFA